jgi:hypothetical protein
MIAGIVVASAGGALLIGALFTAAVDVGACNGCRDRAGGAVAIGLSIGGAVALAVGIPLAIYGSKKVPVGGAPAVAWLGAPSRDGWAWRF